MSTERVLHIKELDLNIIAPSTNTFNDLEQGGSKIVIIGKPGTGKTTLIASLLYNKKHMGMIKLYKVKITLEKQNYHTFHQQLKMLVLA